MELLSKLLKDMLASKASDLFISTHSTPAIRINGKLRSYEGTALAPGRTEKMAKKILDHEQIKEFSRNKEINVACAIPGIGRFRFNMFQQRNEIAMVVRAIPDTVPDFTALGIPNLLKDTVMMKRGLVLVVGPSGAGKSTTLAAMLDHRNKNDISHIVTIEDPIEYIITNKKSIVNQREIGVDTLSYHNALINALRQSPDMIMIGEIREKNVMEDVLEFSDTGHLCLATMHANNASQALERIIHMFPNEQHEEICNSLASNVKALVSQILVPTVYGERTAAMELLFSTPRVSDLIRRGNFTDLGEVMDKDTNNGMCTMDQSLYQHFCDDRITEDTAVTYANSISNIRLQIRLSSPG